MAEEIQVGLRLPVELDRRIDVAAALRRQSKKEYVTELLDEYVPVIPVELTKEDLP